MTYYVKSFIETVSGINYYWKRCYTTQTQNMRILKHCRVTFSIFLLVIFCSIVTTRLMIVFKFMIFLMVADAHRQVGEVAQHINDHIKQHDNFQKMLAIQKSLHGPQAPKIMIPSRVFIKEGLLKKVCLFPIFLLNLLS